MLPSEIMHELNKSYANGFHHCRCVFKDVSAPLESICYLGPHAWYIKENEIKQARQKSKTKRKKVKTKTIRTNTDTVCKGSIQQIILDSLIEY